MTPGIPSSGSRMFIVKTGLEDLEIEAKERGHRPTPSNREGEMRLQKGFFLKNSKGTLSITVLVGFYLNSWKSFWLRTEWLIQEQNGWVLQLVCIETFHTFILACFSSSMFN